MGSTVWAVRKGKNTAREVQHFLEEQVANLPFMAYKHDALRGRLICLNLHN